jgi:cyclase
MCFEAVQHLRERPSCLQGAAALLLAVGSTAWAQDFEHVEIRTTPVKDDLYLLQGYGGNILAAVGRDGTFIVDDEYAPLTTKVMAALAKLTDRPVEFVVNTHWHNDHTGGNEAFGGVGALIVAHENSRTRMMSDQVMALYGLQAAYAEAGWPKITFSKSIRFHYNDDTIDIIHLGPAHTDGDAVVLFRERNVVHTGDLFVGYDYRPPYIDERSGGSLNGMIDAAGALAELIDDDTIIIPGHGEVATRADLLEYRTTLIGIRDRIRRAIAGGKTEDQVVAAQPTSGFAKPGKGTDWWVRTVYEEYR